MSARNTSGRATEVGALEPVVSQYCLIEATQFGKTKTTLKQTGQIKRGQQQVRERCTTTRTDAVTVHV
jgi:phage host-nuclease inhibitor protein Gam